MTPEQIIALKLCCWAFYRREHLTGLNTWDSEAYKAAKEAVKAETKEIYASGRWYVDQWGKLGVNVYDTFNN
jgi:hypothetical protein